MDKYYLHTPTVKFSIYGPYIVRNNPNIELSLNEYTEIPYIDLHIDKDEKCKRPKTGKYDIYKPIDKQTYDSYFQQSIKAIKNAKWDDAEYYYKYNSNNFIELGMFTLDPKNKFHIHVDIRDFIQYFSLGVSKSRSFQNRLGWRKNGTKISESVFMLVLKESIKFLSDENSYHVNLKGYNEIVKTILMGEFIENEQTDDANLDKAVNQLELKKNEITSRLIENDSDDEVTRASLRGEKIGLEYALKTIKMYFR